VSTLALSPGGEPGGASGSLPCRAFASSQPLKQTYPLTTDTITHLIPGDSLGARGKAFLNRTITPA
jgi:hypothetical protein